MRGELEADAERAEEPAGRGGEQLASAGQPDERRIAAAGRRAVVPGVGDAVGVEELDRPDRRLRGVRADNLDADSVNLLQGLPPGDEGGEEDVASGPSSARSDRSASRSTAM